MSDLEKVVIPEHTFYEDTIYFELSSGGKFQIRKKPEHSGIETICEHTVPDNKAWKVTIKVFVTEINE